MAFPYYHTTISRIQSFAKATHITKEKATYLARSGFYLTSHQGMIQCVECKATIYNWSHRKYVNVTHKRVSPTCSKIPTQHPKLQNLTEFVESNHSPTPRILFQAVFRLSTYNSDLLHIHNNNDIDHKANNIWTDILATPLRMAYLFSWHNSLQSTLNATRQIIIPPLTPFQFFVHSKWSKQQFPPQYFTTFSTLLQTDWSQLPQQTIKLYEQLSAMDHIRYETQCIEDWLQSFNIGIGFLNENITVGIIDDKQVKRHKLSHMIINTLYLLFSNLSYQ